VRTPVSIYSKDLFRLCARDETYRKLRSSAFSRDRSDDGDESQGRELHDGTNEE
jgi:hypothetical protein